MRGLVSAAPAPATVFVVMPVMIPRVLAAVAVVVAFA